MRKREALYFLEVLLHLFQLGNQVPLDSVFVFREYGDRVHEVIDSSFSQHPDSHLLQKRRVFYQENSSYSSDLFAKKPESVLNRLLKFLVILHKLQLGHIVRVIILLFGVP